MAWSYDSYDRGLGLTHAFVHFLGGKGSRSVDTCLNMSKQTGQENWWHPGLYQK